MTHESVRQVVPQEAIFLWISKSTGGWIFMPVFQTFLNGGTPRIIFPIPRNLHIWRRRRRREWERERESQFVANRDNSSSVSCRTKNPHDIWRHISIFFRGMSNFFTFSTISRRRTPNDVLQDGKIQRNTGKVTMVFAVFIFILTRKSVGRPHYLSPVPSSLFRPGTSRTLTIFFRPLEQGWTV